MPGSVVTAERPQPQNTAPTRPSKPVRDLLRIVIVGHVDHGKSTLVGRLLHDTGALPDGKVEAIQAMCRRRGMPFEFAFLTDAMQAERDQGVTIDTAQIWFKTDARDYAVIDAPGHTEFLKNMVTGAAQADAAVLVIDAAEGVREQSRRHGYLLSLLGVDQVVVVVNKMDAVQYEAEQFHLIEEEYRRYLASIDVDPLAFVPISAREGDGVARRIGASGRENMPWYEGPTLLGALDGFTAPAPLTDQPLRISVQDVYKFDDRRIVAGRVESGRIAVGDTLMFSPSNKTARVASLERWPDDAPKVTAASAGSAVGITLEDQIFVERGELISHQRDLPMETDVFRARIFWLGRDPLTVGAAYVLKLGALETPATITAVERIVDTTDLSETNSGAVARNQVADVVIQTKRVVALDAYADLARTGRFVLVDGHAIAGGGAISMEGFVDQRAQRSASAANIFSPDTAIPRADRERRNAHKGGVLWLTGLSGAGKSTIAAALEAALFARGYAAYGLDGDTLRHGLNANLGFSPEDRAENIRRAAAVAALMADAGLLVISAFISPYRADRDQARRAVGAGFHEIHVSTPLAECERRDPKGLYQRARAGEINDFTGISAPYEAPEHADLTLDTSQRTVEACVEELLGYVERRFRL